MSRLCSSKGEFFSRIITRFLLTGALIPEGIGGKKYILIHVDDTDRIMESSEENNVAATMEEVEIYSPRGRYHLLSNYFEFPKNNEIKLLNLTQGID